MSDTAPESSVTAAATVLDDVVRRCESMWVDVRRDLHAHPELSWHEQRTTELTAGLVADLGWRVRRTGDSGLIADLGDTGPGVALRADLDALPVEDTSGDPWASTVPGVAHACGHDVHTTALIGAAHTLAALHERGLLPGRVRLLFQPAEEVMPGGALTLRDGHRAVEDIDRVFMLHCDPTLDVGTVGVREGPLTGAADRLEITVKGAGGHTSRPHLTQDVIFALGKVITELPAVLSRRLDPRAGVSVVWGVVGSGATHNVIPASGVVGGTVRMLDVVAWREVEGMTREVVAQIAEPYGVRVEVDYRRGVPPVVNETGSTVVLGTAVERALGPAGLVSTSQSLGGEDFGWFLERVPGAMARLGTRTPGGPTYDLHQGNLRVDDRAVAVGTRVLTEVALGSLRDQPLT